jgi:hypothetical protein
MPLPPATPSSPRARPLSAALKWPRPGQHHVHVEHNWALILELPPVWANIAFKRSPSVHALTMGSELLFGVDGRCAQLVVATAVHEPLHQKVLLVLVVLRVDLPQLLAR